MTWSSPIRETGAVRRKVVKTEGDAHFESLQFIESAGAWSPDGRLLAMAALSGGAPVLTILNAASGSVERELPIRHADQVFNPTWSPDGRRIAFSVLHNGFSDLEVIDLETAHGSFAHVRCVCRSPSRLVAGWPDNRVLDRSFHVVARDVDVR